MALEPLPDGAHDADPLVRHRRPTGEVNWTAVFLGFGGMVLGQFMAVLDIQIVAASLSQIQAGIGATADEISWVQTSYLLAEVVIIPLTAYLSKMWSTRTVYVWACGAFVVTSVMTGFSTSIETMILTRTLQGLAAGAMIPAAFATAMTVFPQERRVTANVVFGLVVTLAPTVGPTLGGHLTDALSWHWLFFINVPIGLVVMFLVSRYADFDRGDPSLGKSVDWLGLVLMTVALLSMQYVLEEGASEGWFDDELIAGLTILAAVTGVSFILRQLNYRQPIVSLKPFSDRNFALGAVMNFVAGAGLFGGTFILPLFLGQVLRYSAAEVGTTMLVSGLVMFAMAPVAGRLVRALDARIPLVLGFGLTAYGIGLGSHVNADWGFWDFAVLQVFRGIGVMTAMIAASQLSVSTLPASMMKDASGLVNLLRNVGGAVGMALLTTVLSHQTAVHLGDLSAAMTSANPAAQDLVQGFNGLMSQRGMPDPEGAANKALGMMLRREASVMGFADGFAFLALACAAAAVLGIFAKPAKAAPVPAQAEGR